MSWFWRDPTRYENERKTWESLGFSLIFERLEHEHAVAFSGSITEEGKTYEFEVSYPSGYPYIDPVVFCHSVENQKHQTPGYGNLCLFEEWNVSGVIDADMLYDRMRQWMKSQILGFKPEDESRILEFNRYAEHSSISAIVITPDSVYNQWKGKRSLFDMSIDQTYNVMRAQLVSISTTDEVYHESFEFFPKGRLVQGLCYRVKETPPYFKTSDEIIDWLSDQTGYSDISEMVHKLWREYDNDVTGPLLGIKYPENGEEHFLVVALDATRVELGRKEVFDLIIFRSEVFSKEMLFRRVAHLNPLQNKKVGVLGCGSIGSSVALELAKAGTGHLTLIDYEDLSVGNVVRHECTLEDVGLPKSFILGEQIGKRNPFTSTSYFTHWWGRTGEEEVEDILSDIDILVCAVGHTPTERYVDDIARRFNVPVIYVYAGLGASSGRVFRVIPNQTGCYHCYNYEILKGNFSALTQPDHLEAIIELGCSAPIFPGSGIDTSSIANIASNMVIDTLLERATSDHILWHSSGSQERNHLPKDSHHCPFCEILEPVDRYGYTPDGKAIQHAVEHFESDKSLFDAAASFLQGQIYIREQRTYTISKIDQYLGIDGANWYVFTEESDPILLDDFFGFDLSPSGHLYAKYQKKG